MRQITIIFIIALVILSTVSVSALTASSAGTPSFRQVKGIIDLGKPRPRSGDLTKNPAGENIYQSSKGFKGAVVSPHGVISLKNPIAEAHDKNREKALRDYRTKSATTGKYQYLVDSMKKIPPPAPIKTTSR